jgi:PST family polysaccharide transporter
MSGLSLYYIPVLSALYDKAEIRKEIFKVYQLIIPLLVLACVITWLLRKPLICFALTKQFLPMEQLFFYQLLALIFQVMSWIICNLMWAKSMSKVSQVALTLAC